MNSTRTSAAPKLTLARKLLLVLFAFTGLFAANFLAYNHLLRELSSTGAAVDAAGRQRMLSQKIAYLAFQVGLGHSHDREALKKLTAEFHETLEAFKRGGPSRNFHVRPAPAALAPLVRAEESEWTPYRQAALTVSAAAAGTAASKKAVGYLEAHSEAMLSACDSLTAAYRGTAEEATGRMKHLMLLLIGVTLLFGAAVFYYSEKNIVAPLLLLDKAAAEITSGKSPELTDGASGDEVGNLFRTFSKMSDTMRRDSEKRAALAGLLALPLEHGDLPELLASFLKNLLAIPWLSVEARGAIFLADPGAGNLVMAAQRGIPGAVGKACANVPFGHCLCGKAAATGQAIFAADLDERHDISYEGMKDHGHYCLPIKVKDRVAGVLNLYVGSGHKYDSGEQSFLEAVCTVIAKTIEYKDLETKARQGQKMESLGRAAGAIAHDFNNILTVAQGFNNLALETVPADSEALPYVEETAAGLDRGAALVKQIMAFSRSKPAEMTGLDLNAVISGVQIMLDVILEKKIRLKLSLARNLPPILGNSGQLEQVLMNLAVNARDAILPGTGEFSITTSEISDGDCAKETGGAARLVRLSVSDTGRGMPEYVKERVFEPFFTTKPEGQGTGLGLATVYAVVRQHKGGISITSSPGKGTTFDICFPASP